MLGEASSSQQHGHTDRARAIAPGTWPHLGWGFGESSHRGPHQHMCSSGSTWQPDRSQDACHRGPEDTVPQGPSLGLGVLLLWVSTLISLLQTSGNSLSTGENPTDPQGWTVGACAVGPQALLQVSPSAPCTGPFPAFVSSPTDETLSIFQDPSLPVAPSSKATAPGSPCPWWELPEPSTDLVGFLGHAYFCTPHPQLPALVLISARPHWV